jgi:TolB-like protein/DNA-binding winged helix-turn-helix (wHTH) protein/Flp pilus assembly protein TadD
VVRFGPFEVDVNAGEVRKRGRRLRLQDKPFRVLEALLEHPGEVVGRDALRTRLWPADTFVDFDTGLNSAVNKVRRVLGDSAAAPLYIETLGRRGYRFIASIDDLPPAAAAVALGWAPASPAVSSLAVLPLANLSGDEHEEYFCDGMTEAVTGQIAGIRSLHVISRQSASRYKNSRQPLPAIARELGVDALVEGSVLRAGGRVRIEVRLVHGASDRYLWSHRWERELSDVLVIQAEIAAAVGHAVAATITDDERARLAQRRDIDPAAYDLYLKGRFCWRQRTRDGLQRSVEYYRKATALAPAFALGFAAEAESLGPLGYLGIVPPHESTPPMRAAVTRALQLDPDLVEGLTALAACDGYHEWRWREAEAHFQRAIALNPNYNTAHLWYGKLLEILGRQDEALASVRRGVALDPFNLRARSLLGWELFMSGQVDEARHEFESVLELAPDNFFALRDRGITDVVSGRQAQAVAAFTACGDRGALAHALGCAGRVDDARAMLAQLSASARDAYVSPFQLALAHLGVSEHDAMFEHLERALASGVPELPEARVDPRFAPLRNDPRFVSLVQRMHLPA